MKTILKTISALALTAILFSCEKDSSTNPPSTSCSSTCQSVQCYGTTQAGTRCQRTTTACCGLCWQHD